MDSSTNNRIIGIDVLKIAAMLLIVLQHLLFQGQILQAYETGTFGYALTQGLYQLTFFAVNCYALATGFLCYKSKIRYSRILSIWLQTFFYSVLIYIGFIVFGLHAFDFKDFISYLLPILTNRYWYITAYFLLFLFIPILNVAIDKISRCAYKTLLLGLFVFMICGSVLYLAIFFHDPFRLNRGYSCLWLFVLYLCGAYIGKYEVTKTVKGKKLIVWFLILLFGAIGVKTALDIFGLDQYSFLLVAYISPVNFVLAIMVFIICLKVDFTNAKARKITVLLSSATLGVFLIHAHPLIRETLTPKLVFLTEYSLAVTVLCALALTVLVFVLCALIDLLRAKLFKVSKLDALVKKID